MCSVTYCRNNRGYDTHHITDGLAHHCIQKKYVIHGNKKGNKPEETEIN
jgi:hypothetical protein